LYLLFIYLFFTIFILCFVYAPRRSYRLDWIWVSIYVIIVVGWIGFRKLDLRPTMGCTALVDHCGQSVAFCRSEMTAPSQELD